MAKHNDCGMPWQEGIKDVNMTDVTFLTPEEVAERYRGQISIGTLCNWRAARIGPAFLKIGKAVLYPLTELENWDRKNIVICRVSRRSLGIEDGEE